MAVSTWNYSWNTTSTTSGTSNTYRASYPFINIPYVSTVPHHTIKWTMDTDKKKKGETDEEISRSFDEVFE